MDVVKKPLPLVFAVAAVLAFVLSQPALGAVLLVAWIGALAVEAMKAAGRRRLEDPTESMDPESRTLFGPIRRLAQQIEEEVASNQQSTSVKVVGAEAVEEARRIRQQSASALQIRGELKKALRTKSLTERDAKELEEKAIGAATEEEREALEAALAARKLELQHYTTVESAIARIDGGIRQAEAALSEMRARLAVSATQDKAELAQGDELRETVGRLKSLSLSYEEAEQMLRE